MEREVFEAARAAETPMQVVAKTNWIESPSTVLLVAGFGLFFLAVGVQGIPLWLMLVCIDLIVWSVYYMIRFQHSLNIGMTETNRKTIRACSTLVPRFDEGRCALRTRPTPA